MALFTNFGVVAAMLLIMTNVNVILRPECVKIKSFGSHQEKS